MIIKKILNIRKNLYEIINKPGYDPDSVREHKDRF